jgi:hypothetical protein
MFSSHNGVVTCFHVTSEFPNAPSEAIFGEQIKQQDTLFIYCYCIGATQ